MKKNKIKSEDSVLTQEEKEEVIKKEMEALFALKGRHLFKRLEEYNTEQAEMGRGKIFYIQDFAVIGVSERKARKKIRMLLGTMLGNPDISKKELEGSIVNIEKSYESGK